MCACATRGTCCAHSARGRRAAAAALNWNLLCPCSAKRNQHSKALGCWNLLCPCSAKRNQHSKALGGRLCWEYFRHFGGVSEPHRVFSILREESSHFYSPRAPARKAKQLDVGGRNYVDERGFNSRYLWPFQRVPRANSSTQNWIGRAQRLSSRLG